MQNFRTKTPEWDSTIFSVSAVSVVSSFWGNPLASLQALTHAPQPMHRVVSTKMALLMPPRAPKAHRGETESRPHFVLPAAFISTQRADNFNTKLPHSAIFADILRADGLTLCEAGK
jgi:hypothetical protein